MKNEPTLGYTHRGRNRVSLGAIAAASDSLVERFIDVECPDGMSFTETITAFSVEEACARVEDAVAAQLALGRKVYRR